MPIKTKTKIKTHIRKNDRVQIMKGRGAGTVKGDGGADRGQRGKVLEVDREAGRAKVQGLRMVYRHQKQSRDPNRPGGGRIQKEAPIALANLMIVCPKCDEPTRIAIRVEEVERDGQKKMKRVRVCKKCRADIPEQR